MRTLTCPCCAVGDMTTKWYSHKFWYGHIQLSCLVPVRCCPHCGEKTLDHVAETIIQNAVDFHRSTL